MPMCNLIEYSNSYLRTLGSSWQYYKDEPALNNNDVIIDFPTDNNNIISLKFKQKISVKQETMGQRF